MSMKYLGESFDIHTGGVDLIFPHHENEIAQSEAATGQPFVKVWLHNAHLTTSGAKMARRVGNIATPAEIYAQGYSPTVLRYALFGRTTGRRSRPATRHSTTPAPRSSDCRRRSLLDSYSDDGRRSTLDALLDSARTPSTQPWTRT